MLFLSKRCILTPLLFCLALLTPYGARAQFGNDTTRRVRFLAAPVVFSSPELGWGFGASASGIFKTSFWGDSLTRTSVINTTAFYTTRRQNVQLIDALIFFPKEKYILVLQSIHSFFPDKFWGVGPQTLDQNVEKFSFEHAYLRTHLRKRFFKHVFAGVGIELRKMLRVNYETAGLFDTDIFYGKQNYLVAAPGLILTYDSRNNANWPTRGVYLGFQTFAFSKYTGSDYAFRRLQCDLRLFRQLKKGHVLAAQVFGSHAVGQVPFRDMVMLGGQNNLRGFYQGRYRDKSMYSVIAEYRFLFENGFGFCVFGGMGSVYGNTQQLLARNIKSSFGGGLRYSFFRREKLNLRLDYGFSNNYNKGFYFTVGECF